MVPGSPVVLPNVWDAASSRDFAAAGFEALATSSGAVARTLGFEDGEDMPADEAFAAVGRISRSVEVPVTADVERGYGFGPSELVERLLEAGAVGCNLEDSVPGSGAMVEPEAQAEWLGQVRAAADDAGVPLVVNARVDVFLRFGRDQAARDLLAEGVDRARRYLDAGADGVYPIFLLDEAVLADFVEQVTGPVNAFYLSNGPSLARLAELGVARITFGGGLHHATVDLVTTMAERLVAGQDPYGA
ncbi:carboxyvinyl-carboxyphosphonate phosphorylmutase [cyanobacterium TDX16]|nr:carboxyvinyl-carboxyphosphonate phosphorylmutase [cyanobacterium TDX16]